MGTVIDDDGPNPVRDAACGNPRGGCRILVLRALSCYRCAQHCRSGLCVRLRFVLSASGHARTCNMQQGFACMADWAGEPWSAASAADCNMACEKHSVAAKGCEFHADSNTCGVMLSCTHTKFHESAWGGHCIQNSL